MFDIDVSLPNPRSSAFSQAAQTGVNLLNEGLDIEPREDRYWREDYQFYGNNAKFRECHDKIVFLGGPAETGKSTVSLCLIHELALKNPGLRGVLCRKVRESMYATVLQTFRDKILPEDEDITCWVDGKKITVNIYGGEQPRWYDYSNGSRIFVAGLDKSQALLSGEFDIILVNQAEELTDDDINDLSTRVTGRAGNIKTRPAQLLGDCNPGGPKHPIMIRKNQGSLTLFSSRHIDNPRLYDHVKDEWTPAGLESLATLKSLTGVRRKRLYEGLWAGADGLYFEHFNEETHGLDSFELDKENMRIWASMDYGFNHPNIIMLHAADGETTVTFHMIRHRKKYPKDIADDFKAVLSTYGLTVSDLSDLWAGADITKQTGESKDSVQKKYKNKGIAWKISETGPGSRIQGAHHLTELLGRPEDKATSPPVDAIPPRWFYVKSTCKGLAECLSTLVPNPKNGEDVLKVDANSEGIGGDDPYDCLRYGLFTPRQRWSMA